MHAGRVHADVEDGVEHAGHRFFRARAHGDEQRRAGVAEASLGRRLEPADPGDDAVAHRFRARRSSPATTPAQSEVGRTKAGGTGRRSALNRASSAAFDPTCAARIGPSAARADEDGFEILGAHADSPCKTRLRSDIAAWASRSVASSSVRAISRPSTRTRASAPRPASSPARYGGALMIAPIAARSAVSAPRSASSTASSIARRRRRRARLPSGICSARFDGAHQFGGAIGARSRRAPRAAPRGVGGFVLGRETDEKCRLVEAVGCVLDLIDQRQQARPRRARARKFRAPRPSGDRPCSSSAWRAGRATCARPASPGRPARRRSRSCRRASG